MITIICVTIFLQNEPQDLLFILTARYRVFILSYKPDTGDVVTRACGDVQVFICIHDSIDVFNLYLLSWLDNHSQH